MQHSQFDNIITIREDKFSTVYTAIWNDGPLLYRKYKRVYTRNQGEEVTLKCLHNTQNITDDFPKYGNNNFLKILILFNILIHLIKNGNKNNYDDYGIDVMIIRGGVSSYDDDNNDYNDDDSSDNNSNYDDE